MLSDRFSTKDLMLAATLQAKQVPLVLIDKGDDGDIRFVFQRTPDMSSTIQKFNDMEITVEPHQFIATWKTLKANVYQRIHG